MKKPGFFGLVENGATNYSDIVQTEGDRTTLRLPYKLMVFSITDRGGFFCTYILLIGGWMSVKGLLRCDSITYVVRLEWTSYIW